MFQSMFMLRLFLVLFALAPFSTLRAETVDMARHVSAELRDRLDQVEAPLIAARQSLPDCEDGCVTPSEAIAMAYAAGEGERTPGRFLLDVRSGGQSMDGELEDLFFVNSIHGYAQFGTLTIAFERDAMWALLRRARSCGGGQVQGNAIEVRGCHRLAPSDLTMFTMMERLGNRRIVVDGEVRLQWIDARTGRPRPKANKRGENELGYYQVWVRVQDADQVGFVYED